MEEHIIICRLCHTKGAGGKGAAEPVRFEEKKSLITLLESLEK